MPTSGGRLRSRAPTCGLPHTNTTSAPVYLAPKTLFARPLAVIANAIGGSVSADLSKRLQTYDYVSFRNPVGKSLLQKLRDGAIIPDTVVMLKRIFGKEIDAEVASPAVQEIMSSTGGRYMAVQCKTRAITEDTAVQLAEALSVVSAPQFNLSIVFFRAGAAPKHDSMKALRKVGERIKGTPVHYFDELNIWRICALISRASMVVSSSLHVRIVSFSFSRPRATIFTAFKHNAFINSWDHGLLPNLSLRGLSKAISNALTVMNHQYQDQNTTEKVLDLYEKSFLSWAAKLR